MPLHDLPHVVFLRARKVHVVPQLLDIADAAL
jgi:hypothetical protein